jgi:hypothetical protein
MGKRVPFTGGEKESLHTSDGATGDHKRSE